MRHILNSIRAFEYKFDKKASWLACHHPCIAFIGAFIGMPLFVLAAVFVCTMAIMVPFGCVFGWL